ncbi:MAG: hypothetical protein L7U72_17690 [Rubripirellula sp.]|nr:hypothetical protein [Rubripirellula sp.]
MPSIAIPFLSRTISQFLLIAFTAFGFFACEISAQGEEVGKIDLAAYGRNTLEPLDSSHASEVRGAGLATRHFGISLISGMLFDPSTASFIKGHSIQLTESEDYVTDSQLVQPTAQSTVTWDRQATLQVETTLNDLSSAMRGVVQATGFSLSAY